MNAPVDAPALARELVAFRTAGQDYGLDIGHVREIRSWTAATVLPHAPDYMLGVINLRGAVVPIIDLARRLGLPPTPEAPRNVVIIVQIRGQTVGLLVEAVFDILSLPHSEIQPTPDIGTEELRAYIDGIATVEERMLRLLCLEQVLPPRDTEPA